MRRLTRFWVTTDKKTTERQLVSCLEEEGYTTKVGQLVTLVMTLSQVITPGIVTVTTTDRRGGLLVFKATLIEMDKKLLLEFRLSRGDGIEFKRRFQQIKKRMEPLILKGQLLDWSLHRPLAVRADALPLPNISQ